MNDIKQKDCCCNVSSSSQEIKLTKETTQKTIRTLPSIALSFLIAFFPKCPVCLAAYLSLFGSFELAHSPYLNYLFPALIALLGLHLILLLKRASQKGYGPFLISLAGALVIICGRSLLFTNKWVLVSGMLLILSGSLWNSFSLNRFKLSNQN